MTNCPANSHSSSRASSSREGQFCAREREFVAIEARDRRVGAQISAKNNQRDPVYPCDLAGRGEREPES